MKKRPIIAISPSYDFLEHKIYLKRAYCDCILEAGGLPVLLSLSENSNDFKEYAQSFDGFLLTGGQDIDANLYGEENLSFAGDINPDRDMLDILLVKELIKLDKPVLGICRGAQMLNVVSGGTLYQDIDSQFDKVMIKHVYNCPRSHSVHKVSIKEDSHLFNIYKQNQISVNSYHHQAIKNVADDFKVVARANDGIIEAIEHKEKSMILGVQWHPEDLCKTNKEMIAIFNYFINKC